MTASVTEWSESTPARETLLAGGNPAVLRGLAANWPAVRASDPGAYLRQFYCGVPLDVAIAPPDAEGRIFYTPGLTGLGFRREALSLAALLARLVEGETSTLAAQAIAVTEAFPGFIEQNRLDLLGPDVSPRIWIGNRVRVATHHDMASNIAVVMAGRRRFTLFPPDQVGNLYLGPFEFTPAGTPVSLWDPDTPDLARFPRAAEAMANALVAELEPGDALYIPHMWWHHVRSLDPLSILVNYWWNDAPSPQPGLAPLDTMVHALLAFAGMPGEQRAAWQAMFDHFVFHADGPPGEGIPVERLGIQGPIPDEVKARLRVQLGQMMAR